MGKRAVNYEQSTHHGSWQVIRMKSISIAMKLYACYCELIM